MPNIQKFSWCYGSVTDIDEENYLVKVNLRPLHNQETGWIKIATTAIGELIMPSKGQLVKVDLCMNDLDSAIVTHSFYTQDKDELANQKHDKNKIHSQSEGKAKAKWKIYRHPWSGAEIHMKEDGEYVIFTPSMAIIQTDGGIQLKTDAKVEIISDGNVEITTQADCTINTSGNANINATGNATVGAVKITLNTPEALIGNFLQEALVKAPAFKAMYDSHVHIDPVSGVTGVPVVLTPAIPLLETSQTKAG